MSHLYCLGTNVSRLANSEDLDEMTHFNSAYTVCYKYEKGSTEKEMFNLEIISCVPSLYIMEHPQINAYYPKEESIKCIDVSRPLTSDLWVFLFQTIDAECVK